MKNIEVHFSDFSQLSQRQQLADGTMTAPGTLARVGIQVYYAYEFGKQYVADSGGDPMKRVVLYRPPEEVFDPVSMASFEGVPLTDGHPPGNKLTPQNRDKFIVGSVNGITRNVDCMDGIVHIKTRKGLDAVRKDGRVQLSNGYSSLCDMTPGVTPQGDKYDGIQRKIRGDHIALVDSARCGSACRLADSQPDEGVKKMEKVLQVVMVDGIPVEVDATGAAAIGKLSAKLETMSTELAAAKAVPVSISFKLGDANVTKTGDELSKMFADHDAQVAQLKKDTFTPEQRDALVNEWAGMIGDAAKIAPKVDPKGKTCLAVRREAITAASAASPQAKAVADAVLGGVAIGDAAPDVVRAAFNAVVASYAPAGGGNKVQDKQLADAMLGDGKGSNGGKDGERKPVGRAAMLARQAEMNRA